MAAKHVSMLRVLWCVASAVCVVSLENHELQTLTVTAEADVYAEQQSTARPSGACRKASLISRLRQSRSNASAEEPLSYMRIDSERKKVALAVLDLWHPKASQTVLDEDTNAILQPFLENVETLREACLDKKDAAGKVLLVSGSKHSDSSTWDRMAREFAVYITRKVLQKNAEVQMWQPERDSNPLDGLLSEDALMCFQTVAVLSGEPWDFAWAQHFSCNTREGRLVRRFVDEFREQKDSDVAQVCLSRELREDVKRLELCELGTRPVQIQVPTAATFVECDVFLSLPGGHDLAREFWLRPSSSVVLIGKQPKSLFVENLAFVAEAKRFTLDRQGEIDLERIIQALNLGPAEGALKLGTAELEGCEAFYHPKGGWMEGWRDVARQVKVARKGGSAEQDSQEDPREEDVVSEETQ